MVGWFDSRYPLIKGKYGAFGMVFFQFSSTVIEFVRNIDPADTGIFAQLEIAFSDDKMIRRVTAFNGAKTLVMDYENISINQNIPDARFDYEAPSDANVFRNFLFDVIE